MVRPASEANLRLGEASRNRPADHALASCHSRSITRNEDSARSGWRHLPEVVGSVFGRPPTKCGSGYCNCSKHPRLRSALEVLQATMQAPGQSSAILLRNVPERTGSILSASASAHSVQASRASGGIDGAAALTSST